MKSEVSSATAHEVTALRTLKSDRAAFGNPIPEWPLVPCDWWNEHQAGWTQQYAELEKEFPCNSLRGEVTIAEPRTFSRSTLRARCRDGGTGRRGGCKIGPIAVSASRKIQARARDFNLSTARTAESFSSFSQDLGVSPNYARSFRRPWVSPLGPSLSPAQVQEGDQDQVNAKGGNRPLQSVNEKGRNRDGKKQNDASYGE